MTIVREQKHKKVCSLVYHLLISCSVTSNIFVHSESFNYPTDEINYQVELEGWLPCLDNMDKLQQFLGHSDKNSITKQANTMIHDQTAPDGAV